MIGGWYLNRTVVVASDTMISDADPSYGSTTYGTDQTTKLQAILDKARPRFALLPTTSRSSVSATLHVYSNTEIITSSRLPALFSPQLNTNLIATRTPTFRWRHRHNIQVIGGTFTVTGKTKATRRPRIGRHFSSFWGVNHLLVPGHHHVHLGGVSSCGRQRHFRRHG